MPKPPFRPPYSAVIITARTPTHTFTTVKIPLTDKMVSMVEEILTSSHAMLQVKLPIAEDEVVVLPTDILMNTSFSIRYIT